MTATATPVAADVALRNGRIVRLVEAREHPTRGLYFIDTLGRIVRPTAIAHTVRYHD